MNKFYFDLPELGSFTSLVLSDEDFDKICDRLALVEKDENAVKKIRAERSIPGVRRGKGIEDLFRDLELDSNMFCAHVKGIAEQEPVDDTAFQALPPETQTLISELAKSSKNAIVNGGNGEQFLLQLINVELKDSPRRVRLHHRELANLTMGMMLVGHIYKSDAPFEGLEDFIRCALAEILVKVRTMLKDNK